MRKRNKYPERCADAGGMSSFLLARFHLEDVKETETFSRSESPDDVIGGISASV